MKFLFLIPVLSFSSLTNITAQHVHHELADSLKAPQRIETITDVFTKGTWGGHVRNYIMVTDHIGDFKTQYADAIGMKVHYTTAQYHGFSMALGGIFSFDLFSSDLAEIDPRAGRHPSFELQLFDVERPNNKYDLDRLEELYLKYAFGKQSSIIIGRHQIFTPFVNPADGRMKPYAFQGGTFDFREIKNTRLQVSYITHVSPRSTVEWHRIEDSIGKYNGGVNPNGEPSEYEGHIKSKGLLILSLDRKFGNSINLSGNYYFADNILSTFYMRADYRKTIGEKLELFTGLEGLSQSKVGNGGSEIEAHTYMCDQDENHAFGYTIGAKINKVEFSFSGLRVGSDGRFLFPREWGRENFYATIPRGRVEGLGDANLYRFHLGKTFKSGLTAKLDYAFLDGPGTNNITLNKYKTPNYDQVNVDLGYKFHGWLKGTSLHFLYVYKESREEVDPEVEYYQANYNHYNLVMNVLF